MTEKQTDPKLGSRQPSIKGMQEFNVGQGAYETNHHLPCGVIQRTRDLNAFSIPLLLPLPLSWPPQTCMRTIS